ncbi:Hypothetical predicted protein [Podarcis lilfordi]|uniref:Uncharacterized protein n=1 Tax=Podarcis lilfordi TaxID=74358 RepID=A0AA35NVS5_9SAUR|nr:Hypothetical predicted protein [Podarcis lilfordi]
MSQDEATTHTNKNTAGRQGGSGKVGGGGSVEPNDPREKLPVKEASGGILPKAEENNSKKEE